MNRLLKLLLKVKRPAYLVAAVLGTILASGSWAMTMGPVAGQDVAGGSASWRGLVSVQGRDTADGVTILVERIIGSPSGEGTPGRVVAETFVEGLEVPWALAFTPGGRILVTERPGRIRLVENGALQEQPLATLEVASVSEAGLMGIALDPDFSANGHLYVCYTYRGPGGSLLNRVARLTESVRGTAGDHRVLLDALPGGRNHNGCRLGFGPGGMLYATMGDAGDRSNAQSMDSPAGKVLRLMPDGSVPPDNPFPGSYVYTLGHRNPQGMDWHPVTGDLFITEHGPSRNDEVNIPEPGGNYGWPGVLGQAGAAGFVDPILTFTPTLALAGAAFYTGDRLPETWSNNLIFANLKASHLHRVTLDPSDHRTVVSRTRLFEGEFGRLRAVAMGPDGFLYFTTSNRDGRGRPRPGDDHIMRLVALPAGEAAPKTVASINPSPGGAFEVALDTESHPPGSYRLRISLPGYLAVERRVEAPSDDIGDTVETMDLGQIRLLAGDLDGDGRIGPKDLAIMRDTFGRFSLDPAVSLSSADLDASGTVDVADLALLGSNWDLGR